MTTYERNPGSYAKNGKTMLYFKISKNITASASVGPMATLITKFREESSGKTLNIQDNGKRNDKKAITKH